MTSSYYNEATMKLITFAVCCYNSAAYMEKCVSSLLVGGEDVEIIIIDDGSKDATGEIADRLEKENPTIVRAVHQENSGHGGGVDHSLALATGKYFKVVDSDDFLEPEALKKFLAELKGREDLDLVVTDYVYHYEDRKDKTIRYGNVFPVNTVCTFKDVHHMKAYQYLTIHSVTYRTAFLKEQNLQIPKKTFYEDNYFIYAPLGKVEKILYLPYALYFYSIGRPDQSVQKKVALGRYKDYVRVALICFPIHDLAAIKKENPRKYRILLHQMRITLIEALIHCRMKNDRESRLVFKKMKEEMKKLNPRQYRAFRWDFYCGSIFWPSFLGVMMANIIYFVSHLVVRFN